MYVDGNGNTVTLGPELRRGGEGIVYDLVKMPGSVAKLYHNPPSAEKSEKLSLMAAMNNAELSSLLAWPTQTLHRGRGTPAIGFIMPKIINHKEVHQLYSPKNRIREFSTATWAFLLNTAANIARAVDVVHQHGLVIGDINHGQILVAQNGTVKMIDCDSFQLTKGGKHYMCHVGTDDFTPPELAGANLSTTVRTPNQDAFGTAVIIFQLLFMGRHPFAGKYLALNSGDMDIKRAIKEHRFVYGKNARIYMMEAPPVTLRLDNLPPMLAELFERAFSSDALKNKARPLPAEWAANLTAAIPSLRTCTVNTAHTYPLNNQNCVWCEIEQEIGVMLFFSDTMRTASLDSQITFWSEVLGTTFPTTTPPTFKIAPPPPSANVPELSKKNERFKSWRKLFVLAMVAWIPAVIELGLLGRQFWFVFAITAIVFHYRLNAVTIAQKHKVKALYNKIASLQANWSASPGKEAFNKTLAELHGQKAFIESLVAKRNEKFNQLESQLASRQMEEYLDKFSIRNASIQGIGSGRKATLQSYSIETAADIVEDHLLQIPGFGPNLVSTLVSWREDVESNFKFNPKLTALPRDKIAIEQALYSERLRTEGAMKAGLRDLKTLISQETKSRAALSAQILAASNELAQAESDFKALSGHKSP